MTEGTANSKSSRREARGLNIPNLLSYQGSQLAQTNQAREPIAAIHLCQPLGQRARRQERRMDPEAQRETT